MEPEPAADGTTERVSTGDQKVRWDSSGRAECAAGGDREGSFVVQFLRSMFILQTRLPTHMQVHNKATQRTHIHART